MPPCCTDKYVAFPIGGFFARMNWACGALVGWNENILGFEVGCEVGNNVGSDEGCPVGRPEGKSIVNGGCTEGMGLA